ncbi:MAG: hypothetical protein H6558_08405 [Lewinellaceae bacterium]|nr:hypothetical protein [Lewinellaceae bacterium]
MNLDEQYEKALRDWLSEAELGLSEAETKASLIRSGDIPCDHPIRQGDNDGESCRVCGERLAG